MVARWRLSYSCSHYTCASRTFPLSTSTKVIFVSRWNLTDANDRLRDRAWPQLLMAIMGKLKCFDIVFSDNKTVYHPGERVTGQCVVELKGDMKMRALRVFMRGVAKVHWTESRSTGTRLGSYTEHYNAEVEYFFKRQVLFGGGTLIKT